MKNLFLIALIPCSIVALTSCSGKSKEPVRDTLVIITQPAAENVTSAPAKEPAADQTFKDAGVTPLTQFMLVEVNGNGVTFRQDLASRLRNLGFKVTTYKQSPYSEEASVTLRATRQGSGGVTKIEMVTGADLTCTIDFANQTEVNNFVESLNLSHYTKNGNTYIHPSSDTDKIFVTVTGKRVVIESPFEL